MVREHNPQGKEQDIKSVCDMADMLLGLGDMVGVRGTTGLLAQDFAAAPSTMTVDEMLQVRRQNLLF